MEQIRSFIAIELPGEVKAALSRLEDELKSRRQPSVKWVDPGSLHLTLKFLGNISAGLVTEITGAIEAAARGIPPFRLEIKGLGAFPNLKGVRVVWVGVSGEIDRLNQFQQRIESTVSPLGFPTEPRPFSAHLTIARLREPASFGDRQAFGELLTATSFEQTYSFNVGSVNLMKSQLTRQGPIYSRLSSVNLV